MGVYYSPYCVPTYWYALGVYISAWASALLVLTTMGNAKASVRGTGGCKTPTLFSYVLILIII